MQSKIIPATLPATLLFLRRLPLPHKIGLLERIYGEQLAKMGISWVKAANGIAWKLDLENALHRWIVYENYMGPALTAWVRDWIRIGDTVVDSGANIGQTIMHYGDIEQVTVYAFEPIIETAAWLKECLASYPQWNTEIITAALTEKNGEQEILVAESGHGHGDHSTLNTHWYAGKGFNKRTIKTLRLDTFLGQRNIDHVRLWKLDVEGAEIPALEGATDLLKTRKIDTIFIEIAPDNFHAVSTFADEFDYRLCKLGRNGKLQITKAAPSKTEDFLMMPNTSRNT